MRMLSIAVFFTMALSAAANAFEGTEQQIMRAVGRTFFGENCEPVRALMGDNSFFKGHYERCLGMLAAEDAANAVENGDANAADRHQRLKCEHYGRAIALWQEKPLPAHGSEKDVKDRKYMLDSLVDIYKTKCQ